MPSRPSAARRRFHTDRIIAKRLAQVRALPRRSDRELVRGRLDGEQWYLGCHIARCTLCHPWDDGGRTRGELRWRRDEERAEYGGR